MPIQETFNPPATLQQQVSEMMRAGVSEDEIRKYISEQGVTIPTVQADTTPTPTPVEVKYDEGALRDSVKRMMEFGASEDLINNYMTGVRDGSIQLVTAQNKPKQPTTDKEREIIGGTIGKLLNKIPGWDAFEDVILRGGIQGTYQRKAGSELGDVLFGIADEEDYGEAAEAYYNLQQSGWHSDEQVAYEKYIEKHGDTWGTAIKGFLKYPTASFQSIVSSFVSMFNPYSASVGGTAYAATTGAGALTGSVGGPVGTAAGTLFSQPVAIRNAWSAAGGTTDAIVTAGEYIEDELANRGMESTPENFEKILKDPEAMKRVRSRALGRGASITAVNMLTFAAGSKILKGVKPKTSKLRPRLATAVNLGVRTGVEVPGEGIGELAAQVAADEDISPSQVILEATGGLLDVPVGAITDQFNVPKYGTNNNPSMSRSELFDYIKAAPIADIDRDGIVVDNDQETFNEIINLVNIKKVDANVDPKIQGEDRNTLIDYEIQLAKLKNDDTETARLKKKTLRDEIQKINSKYIAGVEYVPPNDQEQKPPAQSDEKSVIDDILSKPTEAPVEVELTPEEDVTETDTDTEGVAREQEVPATPPKQKEVSPTEPKTKEDALANLREKQKAFNDLEDQIKPDEPGSPSTFALHDARVELDKAKDIVKKFTAKPVKEETPKKPEVPKKTEKPKATQPKKDTALREGEKVSVEDYKKIPNKDISDTVAKLDLKDSDSLRTYRIFKIARSKSPLKEHQENLASFEKQVEQDKNKLKRIGVEGFTVSQINDELAKVEKEFENRPDDTPDSVSEKLVNRINKLRGARDVVDNIDHFEGRIQEYKNQIEDYEKIETALAEYNQKSDKDALQQVQRKTEKSVLRDKRVEPTSKKETKVKKEKVVSEKDKELSKIATTKVEGPIKSAEFQKTLKEASKVPGFVIDLTKAETKTKGKALPAARPAFYENTQAQTSLDVLSAIQKKYKNLPVSDKVKKGEITRTQAYNDLINLFTNAGYQKTSPVVKALEKGKKDNLSLRDVVNGLSKSIKKSPTETTLAPNIDAFDRILKSLDKTIEGLEKEGKKYKGVLGVGIPPTVPINIAIGGLKVLRAGVAAGKSIKVLINQVHRKFKDYLNKEDTKQFVEDYVDAASRPKDKLRELHGFIDVSNAIEAKVNEKGKQWTKFVTDEKYTGKPFNKREAGRAVASTFVGLESLELTNAVITIGRKASPRLESVFYKEEIAKGTPVQKAKDRAEDKAKSKWWYIGEGYVSALVDKGIVDYDKPSWNPEDPNLIYVLDDDAFNLFIAGSGISLADKPSWSKTSEKPIEKVDGMYYKEKGPDGERLSVIARPTEFQKQVLKAQGKKGKVVQFINKANSQHYDTDTEALDIIEDLFLEGEETFNLKDKNYDTKQLALEQKKIRNAIRGIRDAGGNGYYIHHVASGHGRLLMKVLDNNPQRDKLTRGVTTSRKKEKLGKDGMDVLFAKYSDAHGEGGPSFEERAKFGRSREKEIIEIGSDPRNDRRWIKPGSIEGSVARLAAILEINRALESGNPETFESGVFYLEDVTNSGYQNSAFLTKDPVLGRYTNIIASTIREDLAIPTAAPVFNSFKSPTEEQLKVMDRVHKEIVDLEDKISVATSKAKEDEARGNFINYKGENLADVTTYNEAFWGRPEAKNEMRDVVKHILTAKMYGASVDAAGRNLVNILKTDPTFSNITEENAWFLAQKIFQSFDNKFPKADKLLKGLRSATQEVLKTGNSPAFINDFGFPVQISHYGARNVINTKAKYTGKNKERMGEYVTGSLWSGKGEILWDETVRSGPAIIIQSFEAEIVERLYLKADYPLITIYDNLGTTAANVAKMRQDVKDILVDMFEGNTLERTMDKIVGVDANGKKISDKIMSNIPIGEYKIKDEIYGTEFNITGGKIDKEFLLKRYSQDNTEQLKSSEQVSDIKEGVLVKDSRNMKEISKPCK